MNSVAEIIRDEILRTGPISFARFMELALYAPGIGYYERQKEIGRRGDFYTSVSVGPLFGELLAFQFAEWLDFKSETASSKRIKASPLPSRQILEAGAHDGRLAADILTALRQRNRAVFDAIEYWILEPSHRHQDWQRKTLAEFGEKIRWFKSWEEVPGVNGIIFCNELLDAMPVQVLRWSAAEKRWFEMKVDWNGERFVWNQTFSPIESNSLRLPNNLTEDAATEIAAAAANWWSEAAKKLRSGKLLAIDYGRCDNDLPNLQGTLRGYFRHRMTDDVLANPGEQDITAHVDFAQLKHAGQAAGLETELLVSQEKFLTRVMEQGCKTLENFLDWNPKRTRQFQTLTHPEHLGRAFCVLVQRRITQDRRNPEVRRLNKT